MRILIILCIIGFLLFGCESQIEKQKAKGEEERIIEFENIYLKLVEEKAALLSLKYNIEEKILQNILDEYLSKHDLFYSIAIKKKEGLYEGENYQETILELSKKHNISKEKIANLIIDYKIWAELEDIKTTVQDIYWELER